MRFCRAMTYSAVSKRRVAEQYLVIALAAEWNFEPSEEIDESRRAIRGRGKRPVLRERLQPLYRPLCRLRPAWCPPEETRSASRYPSCGGFGWNAFGMDRTRPGISGWKTYGTGLDRRCKRFRARGSVGNCDPAMHQGRAGRA